MSSVDANIPVVVTELNRSPSPSKRSPARRTLSTSGNVPMMPSQSLSPRKPPQSSRQNALGIVNFRTYCEDLINFDDYPDVLAQDRAIINGFLTGELLKNDKWRDKFPSGKFECILEASSDSESNEFGCKQKIVFKIDFQRVACLKTITRRVWSSKTRAADTGSELGTSPMKTVSIRSSHSRKRTPKQRRSSYPQESVSPRKDTPKRSNSFPVETTGSRRQTPKRGSSLGSEAESSMIELESPIKESRRSSRRTITKESSKRARSVSKATPTKRRKSSVKKSKPKVQNDEVWSVSAILDHKVQAGKNFYLVRWEGSDPQGKPWDDTWEPKQNISRDLIDEYLKEQKTGKKLRRSTGPKSRK